MPTNFTSDVKKLTDSGVSYIDAAKQVRNEQNNNITSSNTMVDTTKFTEASGVYSKQNAEVATGAPIVAPTNTPQVTPTPTTPTIVAPTAPQVVTTPQVPTTPTTTPTVEGVANQVSGEAVASFEANKTIDKTQAEQQKLAAEAKAMETDTELKRYEAETRRLAEEEDRQQKQAAIQEASNMKALQEKERAANEASIAAAQAKADAAERELSIANDIELQKSNVAFAKMGLTMSTAAVTSAQQIYTTGVYNLSKLKTENSFKMSELQVAVAKVEFDHTKVVNDIINKSSEKSYAIRQKLNDDIHTIKNSIIDNRLERQKNIDKAIDSYQQAIKDNEDEVLDKMNKANESIQKQVESYYATLKTKEEYNANKISTKVSNGQWWRMGYADRSNMEKAAGLTPGTIAHQIDAQIGSNIYKQAQEITGLKGITFTSGEYNSMVEEAKQLVRNGIPPETAINQAVTQYISKSPEYQAALAKQRKAGTTSTKGGGGASYGSTQAKEFYVDGKLVAGQFQPGTKGAPGRYLDSSGNVITGNIQDIGENTQTKPNLADAIKAAIAAKNAKK